MTSKTYSVGDVYTFATPPENGNPYRGGYLTGDERVASFHAIRGGSDAYEIWHAPANGGAQRITPGEIDWRGVRPIPATETILRTVQRSMPDGRYIVAKVGLSKLDGNAESYWTATGEVWASEKRYQHGSERGLETSGMIHDEILRAFPELAPIVAMHLSSPDGVPMYAVENGRYHLENGNVEFAAGLWRVSVDELPAIEDVETFVDAQRDRWQREADAAYALLLTL